VEPGYRRHQRGGPGRQHEAAGADALAAGLDGLRIDEAGVSPDDADAEPGIAFLRIDRRDAGDHLADMAVDAAEVDPRRAGVDAEGGGIGDRPGGMPG